MDKHLSHLKKHLRKSSTVTYTKMVEVWIAKIFLVARISQKKEAEFYAWVDAAFSDTGKSLPVIGLAFHPHKINHLGSIMYFKKRRQELSAKLLLGSATRWAWLEKRFRVYARTMFLEDYLHDEETILNSIKMNHDDKFFRFEIQG